MIETTPMNHDTMAAPEDQRDDDSPDDDDDLVAEVIDLETQKRLWLRAIIPLLQTRSRESDPSGRVQLAMDLMQIAACERVGRILRGDVSNDLG